MAAAALAARPMDASAQTPVDPQPLPAWAQQSGQVGWHALILAASVYDNARPLPAASFDAGLMSRALANTRFGNVPRTGGDRLSRTEIMDAVDAFALTIQPGDVALVYFSGHGLNVDGIDYIVPSGARLADPGREPHEYLPVSYFIEKLNERHAGVAVIVIDACRAAPFDMAVSDDLDASLKPTGAGGAGPTEAAPPSGTSPSHRDIEAISRASPETLIAFAAEPGKTAYSAFSDDPADRGSLFTRTFATMLAQTRHAIEPLVDETEREVGRLTGERQLPMHNVQRFGYLYLSPYQRFDDECEEVWAESVRSYVESGQDSYLLRFVGFYPASSRTPIARQRLAGSAAQAGTATRPPPSGSVPLATGVLQSDGRFSASGVLATVTDRAPLRRNWGGIFRSGIVRSLSRGESVLVLPGETRAGGTRVVTANGEIGYVGGVRLLTQRDVKATADLRFSGSGPDATLTQPEGIGLLSGALKSRNAAVRIIVGPSSDPGAGRAAQVSYLRSLRLRQQVVSAGADPSNVTTVEADTGLGPDVARIEVLAP